MNIGAGAIEQVTTVCRLPLVVPTKNSIAHQNRTPY